MPSALAAHPKRWPALRGLHEDGRNLRPCAIRPATANQARFDNYARGLFQEAFSMLAEQDALYVLHRRNLTRIVDSNGDGVADRFDRVAALPHGVADTYDYGYGLVRDRKRRLCPQLRPLRQQGSARFRRRRAARSRARNRRRRSPRVSAIRWAGAAGRRARSSSPTIKANGSPPTSSAT